MSIKSIKTGWNGISALSGNDQWFGDFESIASVTVGSAGAADVEFASIPATYTHLQLRLFVQQIRATYGIGDIYMTINGDTASNYNQHGFFGDGASASDFANGPSQSNIPFGEGSTGTDVGGTFGVSIIDILDYANTNKYKTIRHLGGVDINGTIASYGGRVMLSSGARRNTEAITSIKIVGSQGNWRANSHFALYGIRG
jgi:hypothetical protein